MTAKARDLAVRLTLDVAAPQVHAFTVFTQQFARWWPPEHHIGKVPFAAAMIEPRAGGRWFERGTGGVECDWAMVFRYTRKS